MDSWLALAWGIFGGALLPLYPAQVAVVAVGVSLAVWLRDSRFAAVVALAGVVVGAVRAEGALASFESDRLSVEAEGNGIRTCEGEGVIVSSPTLRGEAFAWDARLRVTSCDEAVVGWTGTVRLYSEASDGSPSRGDRIRVLARLGPMHRFWNDDDPRGDEANRRMLKSGSVIHMETLTPGKGILASVDRARAHVRSRIQATFPPTSAPLARALMLGENDLDTEDDLAFRSSGLSHLLAVSGMHLVLAVLVAVRLFRAALLRWTWLSTRIVADRVAASTGVALSWIYADFAGGSGSAIRAAWMMSVLLTARAFGRRSTGPRAFALSLLAMALADPLAIFDVSVVLSVLATGGLLLGARWLEQTLAPWISISALRTSLAATLSATIACTPALLRMSPRIPLGSLVANLLAGPLGEVLALPLCLVHAISTPFPSIEQGAAALASPVLLALRALAHRFSAEQGGAFVLVRPLPWQIALLVVGGFWIVSVPKRRGWAAFALWVALGITEIHARAAPGHLSVTFLDVGQGDSALLQLPSGRTVLIDGGGFVGSPTDPGTRAILPLLASRRIRSLDVMILSHPHPDHFTGLASVAESVRVAELWDTGQGEREGSGGAYDRLLRTVRAGGGQVKRPSELCGTHHIDGVEFSVIAPCPEASSDRGPNDNSLVVRVRYGRRSVLFTGDAEREEELDLLKLPASAVQADLLKVGHHGSRTSSSAAFLDRVRPSVAVISSGVRNRYGHPHPSTLGALSMRPIEVHRTDREGAITVSTDGETLSVESAQSRSITPTYGMLRYFSAKSSP